MKRLLTILLALGVLLGGQAAFAQTTLTATTLSTAITLPSVPGGNITGGNLVTIASITGLAVGNIIYMDNEAMTVTVVPSSASNPVTVRRGTNATVPTAHASGVVVYYGNPQAFVSGKTGVTFYSGTCTSTNYLYLPVVDTVNGLIGTCDSTTSRWNWQRLAPARSDVLPYHPVASAAYAATVNDYIIGYTALANGARTVTLPTPNVGLIGKVYIVKNESAVTTNTIWVTGGGGTSVDGANGFPVVLVSFPTAGGVQPTASGKFYTNGSNWFSF